jgi:hypothetical protein
MLLSLGVAALFFPRMRFPERLLLAAMVFLAFMVLWQVWRHLARVPERLSEADLLAALDAGCGDTRERELRLRRDAWWAANDSARVPSGVPPPRAERSAAATANLVRLRELLDASLPGEQLMKAEASRQLGDFEVALALLDAPFEDFQRTVADTIRALALRQETTVAEVLFPED